MKWREGIAATTGEKALELRSRVETRADHQVRQSAKVYLGIGSAKSGKGVCAPVARERARQVRDALLSTAAGIRRP